MNKTLNLKFQLASMVWPVARMRDAYMVMLRHSAILEKERLQSARAEDERMLLQDHIAKHSPQRTQSRDTAIAAMPQERQSHACSGCHHRFTLASIFRHNVEWTQNCRAARVKERRNSSGQRVRRLVHLHQFLPKDAETVKLDHFLFCISSVSFSSASLAWRWEFTAMFMLTRDTFSTCFSIVVWGRAGTQFTPSTSRVTVDSASTGASASGERSWNRFQKRVSFQKARTQIRNLESFQV